VKIARVETMAHELIGQEDGAEIPLNRAVVTIGRRRDCDVTIDSIRVSLRHCSLARYGDAVLVRDLGSTNGVRINGHRIESGWLSPGDELSIAHLSFVYRCRPEREIGSWPE
jgi:pSer/pThr/pTyr-binding forkhead associated (FHA) protein